MNIFFVPEARDEFLDAISYYEDARCGLGERFKEEAVRGGSTGVPRQSLIKVWIAERLATSRLKGERFGAGNA